ncbi:MAG: DUF739 family protein [Anaerostipes sp.]|nr:DUF739 family protein [Anaerostipes sp.]
MECIEFDYSKLKGKIKEIFGTQDNFANALNMGRVSLSQRLNNSLEFSQQEMLNSCRVLHIKIIDIPEYFFKEKVHKHELK